MLRWLFGWLARWHSPEVRPAPSVFDWKPPAPTPPKPTEPEGFSAAWSLLFPDSGNAPAPELPVAPAIREAADGLEPVLMAHFRAHLPEPASFPSIAVEVIDLLEHPDPELQKLVALVDKDPAIAVQLLRQANSAFYAPDREIQDLRGAVLRLGVRTSGEIAIAVAGHTLFDMAVRAEYEIFMVRLMDLYHDALTVGFGASEIAFREQAGQSNQAFLGGLFHTIGHALALRSLASLMLQGAIPANQPPAVVDEVLERVHLEIGTTALAAWGLPAYLSLICARIHDAEVPSGPAFGNLHVIRVAAGLNRLVRNPQDGRHAPETRQSLVALGIPRERAAHLQALMAHHWERAVGMLPA